MIVPTIFLGQADASWAIYIAEMPAVEPRLTDCLHVECLMLGGSWEDLRKQRIHIAYHNFSSAKAPHSTMACLVCSDTTKRQLEGKPPSFAQ
jgi:hypothetical protein